VLEITSISRKDGKKIITKKEYVTFFGGVEEFKKLLFDAAARAGYGKNLPGGVYRRRVPLDLEHVQ